MAFAVHGDPSNDIKSTPISFSAITKVKQRLFGLFEQVLTSFLSLNLEPTMSRATFVTWHHEITTSDVWETWSSASGNDRSVTYLQNFRPCEALKALTLAAVAWFGCNDRETPPRCPEGPRNETMMKTMKENRDGIGPNLRFTVFGSCCLVWVSDPVGWKSLLIRIHDQHVTITPAWTRKSQCSNFSFHVAIHSILSKFQISACFRMASQWFDAKNLLTTSSQNHTSQWAPMATSQANIIHLRELKVMNSWFV